MTMLVMVVILVVAICGFIAYRNRRSVNLHGGWRGFLKALLPPDHKTVMDRYKSAAEAERTKAAELREQLGVKQELEQLRMENSKLRKDIGAVGNAKKRSRNSIPWPKGRKD